MANVTEHPRERAKKAPKKLNHIRIYRGEEGGHIVEHHYDGYEHEPTKHPFSDDEGEKVHAHLEKHMGISCEYCGEDTAEEGGESAEV